MSRHNYSKLMQMDPAPPRGVQVVTAMRGGKGDTYCCPACKARQVRARFKEHGKHATLRHHRRGQG